jgi:hypothetical protein
MRILQMVVTALFTLAITAGCGSKDDADAADKRPPIPGY